MAVGTEKHESQSHLYLQILSQTLDKVVHGETSYAQWQEQLRQALNKISQGKNLPSAEFISPPEHLLFMMTDEMNEIVNELQALETGPLHQAAEFFEETIENRFARGDIWLEGMLELGVTYLVLKDYKNAERVLQRLVRICESGGEYSEEMAMAA